jgi:hypothetical protein
VFGQMILAGGKEIFVELMANVFKHPTKNEQAEKLLSDTQTPAGQQTMIYIYMIT